MEQAIVETEKFRAAIEKPPGMSCLVDHFDSGNEIQRKGNMMVDIDGDRKLIGSGSGLSDDDFFHLTCHIDHNIKKNIENGEFVDLDKLLPKDNNSRMVVSNETKLEWVQSEGSTY